MSQSNWNRVERPARSSQPLRPLAAAKRVPTAITTSLEAKDTSGTKDIQAFLFALATCLIIAELSWHLYEKQFLKMKRHYPRGDESTATPPESADPASRTS